MKYIKLITLVLFSSNAYTSECVKDFDDKRLIEMVAHGKAIDFPFESSILIDGEHEPELKVRRLDSSQKEKVVKSSNFLHSQSTQLGAKRLIKSIGESDVRLQYRGPNSGWLVTWYFKKKEGCWVLTALEDSST